jgi:hypothetical protein
MPPFGALCGKCFAMFKVSPHAKKMHVRVVCAYLRHEACPVENTVVSPCGNQVQSRARHRMAIRASLSAPGQKQEQSRTSNRR